MSEYDEKRQLLTDLLNIANRDTLLGGVREDWVLLAKELHRIGYRRVGELAEHDRQVAERAWDEGLDAQKDYAWRCEDANAAGQGVWVRPPENPYRAAKGEQK